MSPKVRTALLAVAAVLALSLGALVVTPLLRGPAGPRPGPPAEVRIGESMTLAPNPGPRAPSVPPAPPPAPAPAPEPLPPVPTPRAEVVPPPPVIDEDNTPDTAPQRKPRVSVVRPPQVTVLPPPRVGDNDNKPGDTGDGGDDGGDD